MTVEYTTITVRGEKLPEPPRNAHDSDHRSGGRGVYRPSRYSWNGSDGGLFMSWDVGDRETQLMIPSSQIYSIKIAWPEAGDG
jgi:hypothetical protein